MITLNLYKTWSFPVMEKANKKEEKENELFLIALGERIAKIRKEQKLTQVELGYRCDFEKSNMRRIEIGGTNPTILTLRKICKGLDIDITELLKGLE